MDPREFSRIKPSFKCHKRLSNFVGSMAGVYLSIIATSPDPIDLLRFDQQDTSILSNREPFEILWFLCFPCCKNRLQITYVQSPCHSFLRSLECPIQSLMAKWF